MENTEETKLKCEKIQKIRKQIKLNSEMIWKTRKRGKSNSEKDMDIMEETQVEQ